MLNRINARMTGRAGARQLKALNLMTLPEGLKLYQLSI
jgi:hypothetical protein